MDCVLRSPTAPFTGVRLFTKIVVWYSGFVALITALVGLIVKGTVVP
jgi:hypothetical protein